MIPEIRFAAPHPSLMASLTDAFGKVLTQRGRPRPGFEEDVRRHVRGWLVTWGDESDDRVRRLVQIKVAGWPRIGVQIVARCGGGDALLAKVRAAGGLLDMDEHGARAS